jgi:hypothetical protein
MFTSYRLSRRTGTPNGATGGARAKQGLTGFGPVRYIYRLLINIYRRAIGHDYFRRRVTVLDGDSGHLHYLIQLTQTSAFWLVVSFKIIRGVSPFRARQYTFRE